MGRTRLLLDFAQQLVHLGHLLLSLISFHLGKDDPRLIQRREGRFELIVPVDSSCSFLLVLLVTFLSLSSLLLLVVGSVTAEGELPSRGRERLSSGARGRSSNGVFCGREPSQLQ